MTQYMYVTINNLCKDWGGFSLRNISLGIDEGRYFALLGPCGSGKTLLLSTIAGLHRPDSGRVYIGEEDVTFIAPERRNIGYLFQGGFLFPHLSVEENIYYGLRYKNASRSYVELVMHLLNIDDKLLNRRDIVNLSGGEARKIALARSLVVRPRLLLVDEPLAFLDPISQQLVLDSLKALNRNLGITTIHVTHTSSEVRDAADTVAILAEGSILQMGAAKEVFDSPNEIVRQRYWGKAYV